MGFGSIWHWLIVLVIVLLVFGAGKLPRIMGDLAKGIKSFRSGMKDDDEFANEQARVQSGTTAEAAPAKADEPAKN